MHRLTTLLLAASLAGALSVGCTPPRSERWEAQLERWPEERPTGATSTELREYNEARDSYEEAVLSEHEPTEH